MADTAPFGSLLLHHPESGCAFFGVPSDSDRDYCDIVSSASDLPAGTMIAAGMRQSKVLPSIDFEVYSEAGYDLAPHPKSGLLTPKGVGSQGKGGLPVVGTPAYAEHPSTEPLCLYYDLKDGKGRRPWWLHGPGPADLLSYIANGGHVEAWNITFEFWIWNMIMVRRFGWPVLPLEQCHCAMAKARRFSLPGGLDATAKVLGSARKDEEGKKLIQKLCRPVKPTKAHPHYRWQMHEAWDDYQALGRYCDQDLVTEDDASARIPDLTDYERRTWLVDQTINARGVQVDVPALEACLRFLEQAEATYTRELQVLTGEAVMGASEVAKLIAWLRGQRCYAPSLEKDTVSDLLKRDDLTPPARRALELRQILGAANAKKLFTLRRQINSDGRLRDQYMYCGADRTGRWSAGGVQLQNITAKGPKSKTCRDCGRIVGKDCGHGALGDSALCPECGDDDWKVDSDWTVEAVEWALHDIQTKPFETVVQIWGDPVKLLSGCLRGLFIAKEGHEFVCCDFSAIEAVVAACVSRCQWRIDVFNTHGKIYEMSASKISGVPFEEMMAVKGFDTSQPEWWKQKTTGHDHPLRKTLGKVAELASGYAGWLGAWKNFGADAFMNDDEIKQAILAWRAASPEIEEMWGGQFRWCGPGKWDYRPELFGLEGAAIAAILNPGQCFHVIDITYGVHDDVLYCRLPSGRFLHYHRPRLTSVPDKLNRGPAWQITFEGYNSNSTKGPIGWMVMDTYGGRLFENVVQAISADIQAETLVRLEARGYSVVMHTHDEAISEVPIGWGSVEEMCAIMAERPTWASWWPIRAAGWRHKRYQKD
jgi:DNA polymerase